jgi:hypothetical protein
MRAKAHQFQTVRIWLPVNQHQIRAKVAVPEILPVAGKGVIEIALRQRLLRRQKVDSVRQQLVEFLAEYP